MATVIVRLAAPFRSHATHWIVTIPDRDPRVVSMTDDTTGMRETLADSVLEVTPEEQCKADQRQQRGQVGNSGLNAPSEAD